MAKQSQPMATKKTVGGKHAKNVVGGGLAARVVACVVAMMVMLTGTFAAYSYADDTIPDFFSNPLGAIQTAFARATGRAVANATWEVDPSTADDWYNDLTTASEADGEDVLSSKNVGRVWTDKTVFGSEAVLTNHENDRTITITNDDPNSALVALSALSSTMTIEGETEIEPLDIVLVLDTSNGMNDTMNSFAYSAAYSPQTGETYYVETDNGVYEAVTHNGMAWVNDEGDVFVPKNSEGDTTEGSVAFLERTPTSQQKMDALKDAATNFINQTASANAGITDPANRHRVSIVKYGGATSDNIGNDMNNTTMGEENATQIVKEFTECTGQGTTDLIEAVGGLRQQGSTSALDLGLEKADEVLDGGRASAKKVVIVFTGSYPTHTSINPADSPMVVYGNAVEAASQIKADDNTVIYNIGVFAGANPSDTTAYGVNQALNGVSSKYPDASVDKTNPYAPTINLGEPSDEGEFYFAANNTDELNNIFNLIRQSIESQAESPLAAGQGGSGSITFTDTTGAYTEVKDFKSIVFAGVQYDQKTSSTSEDGKVTTYTFTQSVTNPNPVYPNAGALNSIQIKVTHSDDLATGDTVEVVIPDTLLPMRHYQASVEEGVVTTDSDPAYPIRVFYTVGVKDEALNTLADPDEELGAYMEENKGQTNCQVQFYSNDYADQANGKTTAVFEPSTENSFYYFAEDTPVLTNNNLQDYESGASHLVGEIDPNATYYWVNRYIVEGKNDWQYEFVAFQGSELTAENKTTDPDTGRVLIKAGTPHADRPSTFTTQKDENKTNTADNAISPSWSGTGAVTVSLGNNGRVTHAVPGIIEVYKDVNWGDGTKDANKEFTFTLLLGDEANTEDVAGTFSYEVYTDGADEPVRVGTIVDGGTFTLKDGEHVVINGVPAGTSYKVVETATPGFTSNQPNDTVSGTTVCKQKDTYTFTNTYTVEPVTLPGEENLPVSKTLTGLSWDNAPEFDFTLTAGNEATAQAVNDGVVTITSGSTTVSKNDVTQGTTGTAYFGNDKTGITFTKPGDYVFTVSEIIPDTATNPGVDDGATQYKDATAEQKAMAGWQLDGITYTNTTHTLTFHVTDHGDGTMTVTPDAGNPDVVFTNEYRATGSATLSAVKAITGRDFQAGDAFTFTVEGTYKGDATVDPVPLPDGAANGSITIQPTAGETSFAFDLGTIAFTAPGTYIYTLTESDQGLPAGVGHDKTVYTVTYVVEDNHKGELTVQGGKPTIQVGDETKDAISWTNAYDPADATETVTASKTLTGRDSLPDEEFTFTLMPTGDTVQAVKDGKITGIDAEKGATVSIGELKNGVAKDGSFGELTFTEAGEYTFEITENRPADATEASNYTHNGVTYDATTGTVTITVTDLDDEGNNTGQLVANVEYGTTTETDNVFINTYKPTPTTGKVAVSGTKTVDDQIGTFKMEDDQFAFSFAPAGNAPMPDPEKTQIDGVTFVTQNYGGANHTVAKVTNTGTKGLTSKFDFSKLEIPFTQAGEYQYYVVEDDTLTWEGAPDVVPGISYDGTQYRVTFVVNENQATGTLSASISNVEVRGADDQWTQVGTDELDFENVYSAEVKQNRQINKTLNGRNFIDSDTLQFDVEVTAVDHTNGNAPIAGSDIPTPTGTSGATMSQPVVDGNKVTYHYTVDPAAGTDTATFNTGDVTYTHVGTYTYTISEHGTGAVSVDYDASKYVIVVKIDQATEGGQVVLQPTTTITKDGETYELMMLNFVNSYTTAGELDGDTYLKVSKTVANRPWNDGESFDFTITAKTGPNNMAVKDIPMPASSELKLSKNGDEATVTGAFDDIEYTVPGTYTYEIAEKGGSTGGLTYSGAKYTVTVTATDQHDGTMNVTATMTRTANDQGVSVSGDDAVVADNTAAFTNTYTPGTATLTGATDLVVTKSIDGREWQDGDTFSFTLAADMNDAATKAAVDAGQITMSGTTATVTHTSSAGDPDTTRTTSFGNIQFTKAGTYQFIVTEDASTVNGVDRPTDYDRTVVVEVTENTADGTMTAKLAADSELLTFTNVYNPDPLTLTGDTALKVQKTLPGTAWANGSFGGRNWSDGETFGFTIARTDNGAEDAVTMPADATATVGKPADGSVNTANFGDITFNEPGTYTFQITETAHNDEAIPADPQDGMTYDGHTATVTVTVKDNKAEGKLEAESVIYANDGAQSQTDRNNTDIAAFTNTYTATSGTYDRVNVAKVLTGRDWLDTDSFTFDLALKEATSLPAGAPNNAAGLYKLPDNAANLSVTNQSSPVQTGGSSTGYSAQYGAITFHAPGLYTFTVTEDVPEKTNGITYDQANPKEFTVQVTDNGQGQLEASLADDSSSNLQFTNSYAATGELTGSTYLKVAKNLPTTRPWGDGDTFTMRIEAVSNTAGIADAAVPMPADTTVELTKGAQSGNFGDIAFTKAGQYVYRITEQRPADVDPGEKVNGLIYSQAVYEVTVTVKDNDHNGTFDVSSTMTRVTNSDGSTPATPAAVESNTATFRNDYQPTGQLVGADFLKVSKTLEGRSWADGETYTFQLEGTGSAPMPDGAQGSTITLDLTKPADGKTVTGSFGNITFTSVTTSPYTYTITETGTGANGVTFSKAEYQVSVTVTDPDHNGVLDVQSTMTKVKADNGDEVAGDAATVADNTAAFTNTYEATGTLSGAQNLEVTKVFTGRDNDEWLDGDSFEFTIAPNGETTQKAVESGAVTMPDQTTITIGKTDVNGDGAHAKAFGDITFKGSGEATYQFSITETDSKKGGIKYDTAPRIITVKVTDNGTGTLTPSIENEGGTSNNLTFTNLYGTSGDLAAGSIEVTKAITGRDAWNENESYSFSIALDQSDEFTMNSAQLIQTPAAATIAADDEDKAASFGAITFGDVPEGVYRFIVTENAPADDDDNTLEGVQQDGVTYDEISYRIAVKVEDNNDGGLTATLVDPDTEATLEGNKTTCAFTNSYAARGSFEGISATKSLTGRDWQDGDSFEFKIEFADDAFTQQSADKIALPSSVAINSPDNLTATFDAITFGDVPDGDYTFVVSEVEPTENKIAGVEYDKTTHEITLNVADQNDGTLKVTVADGSATDLTFTNSYKAKGSFTGISVAKTLDGRDWTEGDSFEFTLTPQSENAKTAVDDGTITLPGNVTIDSADEDKTATFGAITFDDVADGRYTFVVSEVEPTENKIAGVEYDGTTYEITLNVADQNDGTLEVTVAEDSATKLDSALAFTNTYEATGELGADTISVIKSLTGRDWQDGDTFQFQIELDETGLAEDVIDTITVPAGPIEVTNGTDGHKAAFGAIGFNDTPDGEYTFVVSEVVPEDGDKLGGVTYDADPQTVKVKVTDDGKGGLTASLAGGQSGELTFENSYAASGELPDGTITVTKNFTGRPNDEWLSTDSFTFTLAGGDEKTAAAIAAGDIVLPERAGDTGITIVDGTADHKAAFGAIRFGDVADGDYTFTVTEQKVENNGITYADPQTVTVTVTDNNDGTLKVEPKDGSNELTFTNTYEAAETTATLNVEKVVTGANAPEDFKFALDFDKNNQGPEDGVSGLTDNTAKIAGADLTLADGADQDAESTSFGKLTFSKEGVYTFAISETNPDYGNGWMYDNDDPNTVTVTVEDNDDGALVVRSVKYTDDDAIAAATDTAATFTNRYTAGAAVVDDLSVTKQVEGNATDEDFTFELTLTSDNAANVEGLGEGNKTTATAADPFNATANKAATQKVTFSPLIFTEPGDYTFTVAETNTAPENTSWTYGNTPKTITVKVRDNGSGSLVADGSDPDGESGIEGNNPTIVNRFEATGTAVLAVEKVIDGRSWIEDDPATTDTNEADSFSFQLAASDATVDAVDDGNVIMPAADGTVATVTADTLYHRAEFGEIIFKVPGTYTFTVTEQGTSHDGLTYDTAPKEVTVAVTDNGNGKLEATVQDNADSAVANGVVTITNTYGASGTVDRSIDLTKVLSGRAWDENDAFTFTIAGTSATAPDGQTAIDPIPLPDETQVTLGYTNIAAGDDGQPLTTADGWNYADFTFGAIEFSKPGTYVYTVTEADTGNPGMKEPAAAEVTVLVTDNQHGGYTAAVTSVTGNPLVNTYGAQLDYNYAGGLAIVKNMSNQDIAEGAFTFTVTPDDAESAALLGLDAQTWTQGQGKQFSTHAADLTIDASGNGVATTTISVLDNAAFTHEHDGDTYGFTVAETDALEGSGHSNDATVYHVAITVEDNSQGTLTATTQVTVQTADANHPHSDATYTYTSTGEDATGPAQVTFNNDYDARGSLGTGAIKATKTLVNGQLAGNDFGFSVYAADGTKVASGTNDAAGNITFSAISYSTDQLMQDIAGNTASYAGKIDGKDTYAYQYTVREDTDPDTDAPLDPNGGSVPGVTVNAGSFQITVTVTDNGDGTLTPVVTYPQDADHLAFQNTYGTVPGGAETLLVGGRKALDTGTTSGENVPTLADIADKYTFKIQGSVVEGEDGPVPMPERTTATNDAAGNVTFGNIEFSIESVWGVQTDAADGETADGGVATQSVQRTKRFQYLVSEEGDVPGITNGVAQAFFVTVTDNGDGTVDVKCTSGNTGSTIELTPGEQFTITNEYRVAPVESSVTDAVSITKTLDGRALNEGEFTFDMALVSAPGETNPGFSVLTATNDADGAVSFPKLTFSQVGTYVYRISEEHGDLGGIAYDDSTYTATATVTDNGDGTLSVEWAVTDADGQTVGKKGVIFANTYTADPATVGLAATKVLGGRELKDGEFTFELARTGEDAPMPGDAQEDTIRLTNAADGTIAIDPIIFTQPGEYRYTLREVNGDAEGVTYDDAEHVITVTVTDNLLGALEADVSIDDGAATGIVFTNTYTAPAESDMPASGSAVAGTAVIAAMLLIAAAGIGVASKRSASRRGSNR